MIKYFWRLAKSMSFSTNNSNQKKRIGPKELASLHESGFKLTPLSVNNTPSIESWTPIYEDPYYWNNADFDDPKVYSKFHNVASTLGKTHIKDSEGNELYIQVLDIDSEAPFTLVNTPISQLTGYEKLVSKFHGIFVNSWSITEKEFSEFTILDILKMFTFVTKTRSPWGYHIWWLSHKQNTTILKEDCKIGCAFEIFTGKHLCTLPPSAHRDDKKFNYYWVGITDNLLLSDDLYPLFVELFKDCLRDDYYVNKNKASVNENEKIGNGQHINTKFHDLSHETIQTSVDCLLPFYIEHYRNNFVLSFSGMTFHSQISEESAKQILEKICEKSNDSEKKNRIATLQCTYRKGLAGQPITGTPSLTDLIVNLKGYEKRFVNDLVINLKTLWKNDIIENDKDDNKTKVYDNKEENDSNKDDDQPKSKSIQEILIDLANKNIEVLFKDQLNEGFASVFIKDHYEIIPLRCSRFKKFLSKIYYENTNKVVNTESINNVLSILQAKAEFGDLQYSLSLRVAEHDGNIYYDLTNEKHQIIEISKSGNWKLIDKSPIPLFKRYNQTPQDLPSVYKNLGEIDPLDDFISNLTNIKDKETRLLIKVAIVSFFVPNIPHTLLIIHGGKGSAKSTFMSLIKYIVDPSKPPLLTIHDDKREFIQQLAHNYVAAYDNLKYNPKWLSDEACKAITGIGQSKRANYTDDEDKIFEYKHCLLFNGINIAFSEPDIIDRSIIIDLPPIKKNKRKTEKEILQKFFELRPKILQYIFDILSKAVVIKRGLHIGDLPRMADFAVWCEAISRAMGYKEYDFLDAYYHNIRYQNIEVIDSNPVAFAVKKFVEHMITSTSNNNTSNTSRNVFRGPPAELLDKLNSIAIQNKINTQAREWPKDQKWLIRRLNTIKSNLQDELDITINIDRESKTNTSIIEIYKNDSDDSEIGITPEANRLPQSVNDEYNKNDGKSPTFKDDKNTDVFDSGHNGINGETLSKVTSSSDDEEEKICETKNTIKNNEFIQNGVSFDLEWLPIDYSESNEKNGQSDNMFTKIIAAAFVDGKGNQKVIHIDDYSSFGDKAEANLLIQINKELPKYRYSYGWNSTSVAKYDKVTGNYIGGIDSDLSVLHSRCKANNIDSIVEFNYSGVPYIKGDHSHIDLYNIFSKSMIQTTIYNNKYRTLKLSDVSKAVLGDEKGGKFEGKDGVTMLSLPIEKQKQYVLKDAQLVMDLAKHKDGEILDCMKSISDITGLDFVKVCRTDLSSWWASIFDNMIGNGECIKPILSQTSLITRYNDSSNNLSTNIHKSRQDYSGGKVLPPKKGFYQDLYLVDVISLYPSMAILHNISFDTVNCSCCKDDPTARIDKQIIQDCVIEKEYWICRLKEGAFPKKLKVFKEERINQKKAGNKVKQLALKILINGGYGVFANDYFKYRDKRVAELITAYGRYTLNLMEQTAISNGFEVIAGDTDSLFLHSGIDKIEINSFKLTNFINDCKNTLKIDVVHEKTFTKAIILKKKHYVGITEHGEIIIKGMEGIKNDRPQWINTVFESILKDILIHGNDPLIRIKEELQKLREKKIDLETLKIYTKLSKNPEEYRSNNIQKKIGILLNAKANDLIYYFKSDNKDGVTISSKEISLKKYKDMLIDNLREILQVSGYDVSKLYS